MNRLSLSSYNSADLSPLCSDVWGPCAGRSGHCCGRNSNSSGRLGLRRSGLVSIRFIRRSSPSPRKNDLTNYWALGPFVRSFILPVDPGDICPPHNATFGRSLKLAQSIALCLNQSTFTKEATVMRLKNILIWCILNFSAFIFSCKKDNLGTINIQFDVIIILLLHHRLSKSFLRSAE